MTIRLSDPDSPARVEVLVDRQRARALARAVRAYRRAAMAPCEPVLYDLPSGGLQIVSRKGAGASTAETPEATLPPAVARDFRAYLDRRNHDAR
jgi:hypothetical protein